MFGTQLTYENAWVVPQRELPYYSGGYSRHLSCLTTLYIHRYCLFLIVQRISVLMNDGFK